MIWTLKVACLPCPCYQGECVRAIEIDSESTLERLHLAIQEAVDFDNDHMYQFVVARTPRSRSRVVYSMDEMFGDDPMGEEFADDGHASETTLEDVFPLKKGDFLFYNFDFGDDWWFKVSRGREKEKEPEKGAKYPRVVKSVGKNPEQYPGCEDEE
jgi:hypothetical protein